MRNWIPDLPHQDYQIESTRIDIPAPHRWAPPDLVKRCCQRAGLPTQLSLLDETLAERVARAFKAEPWIYRLNSVQIERSGTIKIDCAYRNPVAMIETPSGLYPIDREGVLLPPEDFSAAEALRFPLIRNVASQPQGIAGQPWGDPVIKSAAKLAEILVPDHDLERHWNRLHLRSIDVASVDPKSGDQAIFELGTVDGSRILWGKAPGADTSEPPPDKKMAGLTQYLARYGRYDKPKGRGRIDVRAFDKISYESLENSRLK